MVKAKNNVAKIVALTLVLALMMSVFAFIMPKHTVAVEAAGLTEAQAVERRKTPGLYEANSMTLKKSWAQLLADGDIRVKGEHGYTGQDGDFRLDSTLEGGDLVVAPIENLTNLFAAFGSPSNWASENLNAIDIKNWDTSNVTRMDEMFAGFGGSSLDLSSLDTSKVTNMTAMFYYCCNLVSLDLSNFDTSNVTNMSSMVESCNSLKSLDLSNFDTSKVTDMSSMFATSESSSLKSLDISSFDMSKLESEYSTYYMFNGLNLETLRGPKICNKTFKDCSLTFTSCVDYKGVNYSSTDTLSSNKSFGFNGASPLGPKPSTPAVPSTGVVANAMMVVVPFVLVIALCVVARKKQTN